VPVAGIFEEEKLERDERMSGLGCLVVLLSEEPYLDFAGDLSSSGPDATKEEISPMPF